MAVEMAKLCLSGLSTGSNMLFIAIFRGTAVLLVTVLRVIQLPGWAVNCLLCLLRQSVETAIKTGFDTAENWLVSAAYTGSELVTNATTTAVSSVVEAAAVQKELVVNGTAEVFEFALETGAGIWLSFCENFWEAVDILMKNGTKVE